ncbi:MAG: tetratricopeptide repeat protein [bacterium]|nr:tetratricopeptide repeat protein [bacterium]
MHSGRLMQNALFLFVAIFLTVTACQSTEAKVQKHLAAAQVKIEAGENTVARIELLNALKLDPGSSQAYFLLGKALVGMKDFQGAAGAFANANELAPDDREIALEFSRLLLAGRAYPTVEPILQEWTIKFPEDQEFLIMLSVTQAQLGKADKSEKTARRVIDLYPEDAKTWLNLAQVYLMNRDQVAAEGALRKAEELDPGSISVSLARIGMLQSQGQMKEAAGNLESLAAANPDRNDLKVMLARMYEGLGRKSDAIRLYREVSASDPSAPVLHRLGLLLYETDEKEDALALWARSVEIDPNFREARLSMAAHHMSEKNLPQAREMVDEALQFAPQDAQVLAMSGQIHMAQGKPGEAAADLAEATKLRPEANVWRLQLAQAQLAGGDTSAAMENLRALLEKDPGHVQANLLLAKIEANAGNLAESSRYAKAASADEAVGREAMWILGDNALKGGDVLAARALYERNMNRHGAHPGTRFRLARSKDLLKEYESAEKDYRTLLDERPKDILLLTHLVSLLGRTGREEEALEVAREKAETGVPHQLLLGRVLEGTENAGEARDVYLALTRSHPDLMAPYQRIIALYARDSDLKGAESWLTTSVNGSDTPQPGLLVLLGMVQDVLGKKEEAVETYREVLRLKPDFVPAMNNLAWNLAESGALSEALEIAAKARKQAPENPSLADTYGWILHKSGDSAGALPVLRQALEGVPDNEDVRLHLVEVLKAVGRDDEAQRLMRRAGEPK